MKKIRDQARKENKALKRNAKGKAKAVKAVGTNAMDNMVAAKDAVSQKATDTKDSVVKAMQTVKADAGTGIRK